MNTILLIIILIFLLFFLSSDIKFNNVMKNQSLPFLFLLIVFYFFFNKIDFKLLVLALVITVLFCSNILNNRNIIMEHLKLKIENDPEPNNENEDQEENDDQNDIENNNNSLENLQNMFKELDEQINDK